LKEPEQTGSIFFDENLLTRGHPLRGGRKSLRGETASFALGTASFARSPVFG
jgi:hypothetical protein